MESRDILEQYVTNTEDQVFAIKNLSGMVGAVMARYSRAESGLRETLLREFIKEDRLNPEKAYKLIERVLIAYGDDSVGELEGAHLSFEGISLLATKVIEHRRIGGSPIEQSTRYVRYDFQPDQDGFHYHLPTDLDAEGQQRFRADTDRIFQNYSRMWQPLVDHLEAKKPIEEATYDLGEMGTVLADMKTPKQVAAFKRTYRNDIKTKACDILRGFLPLSTRANVGVFGNGRYFQHLISRLWTAELAEANELGEKAHQELSKLIPHYVRRAKKLEYVLATQRFMAEVKQRWFADLDATRDNGISLVEPDHAFILSSLEGDSSPERLREAYLKEQNLNFLASLVYGEVRGSFQQIRNRIKELPDTAWQEIMSAYYGTRETRRDRPERGIEHGYPYTFDLVTEWAVYKDLMRHRMATIQIQDMRPDLGFEMPPELEEAGLVEIGRETVAIAESLFAWLDEHHPQEREYAILQGHRVRWLLGMNDRALMHMLELRTAPQGHPNYRATCVELYHAARQRFPDRVERMKFVNLEGIYWSRSDSEARQRVKESQLEE